MNVVDCSDCTETANHLAETLRTSWMQDLNTNLNADSLLVCGFLWSGSSAVVDLLRSSESIGVLPGEFDEFRRQGMVADHLEGLITDVYPSRLLPKSNLLSKLKRAIPLDRRLKYRPTSQLIRLRQAFLLKAAEKLIDQRSSPSEKMRSARELLVLLKKQVAPDKKYLLIDQPILLGQHLSVWPEFFEPFKLIVVARNPLDQFAEVIRQNHLFLHFRSPEADIWGGGRSGAFSYVLHTLLIRIIHYQKIRDKVGMDRILFVKFEDLVGNSDSVVKDIAAFLEMDVGEIYPSKFFAPSISAKNIGIHNQILTKNEVDQLESLLKMYESCYELKFREPMI